MSVKIHNKHPIPRPKANQTFFSENGDVVFQAFKYEKSDLPTKNYGIKNEREKFCFEWHSLSVPGGNSELLKHHFGGNLTFFDVVWLQENRKKKETADGRRLFETKTRHMRTT